MRLRCTRTQRRPTSRSRRISTRPLAGSGEIVPEIAIARPWRTRWDERPSRRVGRTWIATGEEASGWRAPSPRKAARIRPLTVSGTLAAQLPSTAQTVPAMRAKAAPGTANSMSSGAPEGEEPSGKARLAGELQGARAQMACSTRAR